MKCLKRCNESGESVRWALLIELMVEIGALMVKERHFGTIFVYVEASGVF